MSKSAKNDLSATDPRSKSIRETVNGCHHFMVKDFSSAKRIGVGKRLSSDSFKVGGYEWVIYVYPGGCTDFSNYVSVFVALTSHGTDVRALFEFMLVDQSGKGRHIVRGLLDRPPDVSIYKCQGSFRGFKDFVKRSDLETSNCLKNDCLLLHCKVGVSRNCVVTPRNDLILPVPSSNMGQAFMSMFDRGVGCDIVFHVDGETFNAHKVLLSARSPVFMAQFYGNSNVDKVVIEDVKPYIFKAMITFIYSDRLPDVHEIADCSSCSSEIIIRQLLAAAERYGVARLKLLCEVKLYEERIVDTVSSSLKLLGTKTGAKRGRNTSREDHVELKRLRSTGVSTTLLPAAQVYLSETCCDQLERLGLGAKDTKSTVKSTET